MKYYLTLNIALSALLVILINSGHQFTVAGQIEASTTMLGTSYSELDSCHYPVKGGCLTASGVIANNQSIACPRSWPLFTEVLVNGELKICHDRYNKNLSDRIDIWQGMGNAGYERAKEWGVKEVVVVVL